MSKEPIYISESVIGDDRKVAEHMKEVMWKFPLASKEYQLAQKTFAFIVERMRQKEKVCTKKYETLKRN